MRCITIPDKRIIWKRALKYMNGRWKIVTEDVQNKQTDDNRPLYKFKRYNIRLIGVPERLEEGNSQRNDCWELLR